MQYIKRFLASFSDDAEMTAAEEIVRLARESGTLDAFRSTAPASNEDTYSFFGDLASGEYHFSQDLKKLFGEPAEKPFYAVCEIEKRITNEVDNRIRKAAIRALTDGAPRMVEYFRVELNGETVWTCIRCARVHHAAKGPLYVCGSVEFISDRRILLELFQFTHCGEKLASTLGMLLSAPAGSSAAVLRMTHSTEPGREDLVNLISQRLLQHSQAPDSVICSSTGCCGALVVILRSDSPECLRAFNELLSAELASIGLPLDFFSALSLISTGEDCSSLQSRMPRVIEVLDLLARDGCATERSDTILSLGDVLELYRAIKNNFSGFELHFQPVVSRRDRAITGGELLIRFRTPHSNLGPNKFIPVLEKTPLAIPLGRWTFEEALRAAEELRHSDWTIGFNVSPIQVDDPLYLKFIMETLKSSEEPAERFLMEITETSETLYPQNLGLFLKKCREMGMRTAIDDFGTGYNSIEILLEAPFDVLKFSRSLTAKALRSEAGARLLGRCIAAAREYGAAVCVEGVETARELAQLDAMEPDFFQGWYFSRPVRISVAKRLSLEQPLRNSLEPSETEDASL